MIKRLIILATSLFLLAGCGNKIDLPQETPGDFVPFKNYFVYAEWEDFQDVTDILVTRAQWVYVAQNNSSEYSVKRYRRKGANVDGEIVAKVIGELTGFEKPIKLDEGADNHVWVLDLTDEYPFVKPDNLRNDAEVFEDLLYSTYISPDGSIPIRSMTGASPSVSLYDLFSDGVAFTWADTMWSVIDTTWRQPGRDSAKVRSKIRKVELTALSADEDDRVYVTGTSLAYRVFGLVEYDTTYAAGNSYGDPFEGLAHIGYEETYQDTTMSWFVRAYDTYGNYEYEVVGTGTGVGYGEDIYATAVAGDYIAYIDGALNLIKINDPSGSYIGITSFSGEEAFDSDMDPLPFDLLPGGIAGDPSGNIYIADSGNGRILKYNNALMFDTRVDQNDTVAVDVPTAIGVTDSLVYVYDETESKVVLFEFPKNEE